MVASSNRPVWHFGASRAGLVPVLIYDCLIAYFYYGWQFTGGTEGLPPKYTLALLAVVHGFQLFVFLFELAVRLCQFVWSRFDEAVRYFLRRVCLGPLGLVVLLGLCVFIGDSYLRHSDPYIEGSVPMQSGLIKYKHYKHDQSVHYYLERKDPRDGIVVTILCTEGTRHLVEKTYVRCLYRKPSEMTVRPPMRAPGTWVTAPLTAQDTEVLETLKKNRVLP